MKKKFKDLERKQLVKKLNSLASSPIPYAIPREGWVRTLRKVLGMTSSQLAKRLGVQQSRVSEIEKGEIDHKLTLKTLISTAQALGCRFEYAFIPEKSIEQVLKERAYLLATEKVEYISHHMLLEDQALSEEEKAEQIKQLAEETLNNLQTLWES
jgi:predicted DNA-binding mobile mystery protein A